jgi:hypothetical protein
MERSGLDMSGRRRLRRTGAFAVLVTVVALVVAGCGGNGGAKKGTASPSASGSGSLNPVAYAQCMRANGLPNFPDPDKNGNMALPRDIDTNSTEYKKATEKCKQYMGSGGTPNLGANDLWSQDDKLKYARCMRENGVPSYPDPGADGQFPPFGQGAAVDPGSAQFKQADKACAKYKPGNAQQGAPGGGPGAGPGGGGA